MRTTIAAAILLCILVTGSTASAQLAFGDGPCAHAFSRGVQRLAARITREQVKCHLRRMQQVSGYPYGLDCNDPGSLPDDAQARIARAEELLLSARFKCSGLSSPGDLGYNACPFPCDGIPISTYEDVSECLACVASEESFLFMETLYGAWPDPPVAGANTRCQHGVGYQGRKYKLAVLKTQLRCERLLSRGAVPETTNCETYDPEARALGFKGRLDGVISKHCTDSRLADLASCAPDVATEKACAEDAAEVCATNLLNSLL